MISIFRLMVNSNIGLVCTFLFLGLAALAFAAGDISGGGGTFSLGGNNGTVAKVGSARLTANDLQSRTELVFDRQRQQSPDLDMSSFLAMGAEIGRAHVCTPVTNAQLVCRLLLEKKTAYT